MTVYRILSGRYAADSGEGARLYGGRWNYKGTPLIYAGQSVALCALEVLANSTGLPSGLVVAEIDIPESLEIGTLQVSDLPRDWNSPMYGDGTPDIGTAWPREARTAILSVPSSVIPRERNFLLNPLHKDFGQIGFGWREAFQFDTRLRWQGYGEESHRTDSSGRNSAGGVHGSAQDDDQRPGVGVTYSGCADGCDSGGVATDYSRTAMRLGRYFSTTSEFWMNLQRDYELRLAARECRDWLSCPQSAAVRVGSALEVDIPPDAKKR